MSAKPSPTSPSDWAPPEGADAPLYGPPAPTSTSQREQCVPGPKLMKSRSNLSVLAELETGEGKGNEGSPTTSGSSGEDRCDDKCGRKYLLKLGPLPSSAHVGVFFVGVFAVVSFSLALVQQRPIDATVAAVLAMLSWYVYMMLSDRIHLRDTAVVVLSSLPTALGGSSEESLVATDLAEAARVLGIAGADLGFGAAAAAATGGGSAGKALVSALGRDYLFCRAALRAYEQAYGPLESAVVDTPFGTACFTPGGGGGWGGCLSPPTFHGGTMPLAAPLWQPCPMPVPGASAGQPMVVWAAPSGQAVLPPAMQFPAHASGPAPFLASASLQGPPLVLPEPGGAAAAMPPPLAGKEGAQANVGSDASTSSAAPRAAAEPPVSAALANPLAASDDRWAPTLGPWAPMPGPWAPTRGPWAPTPGFVSQDPAGYQAYAGQQQPEERKHHPRPATGVRRNL